MVKIFASKIGGWCYLIIQHEVGINLENKVHSLITSDNVTACAELLRLVLFTLTPTIMTSRVLLIYLLSFHGSILLYRCF